MSTRGVEYSGVKEAHVTAGKEGKTVLFFFCLFQSGKTSALSLDLGLIQELLYYGNTSIPQVPECSVGVSKPSIFVLLSLGCSLSRVNSIRLTEQHGEDVTHMNWHMDQRSNKDPEWRNCHLWGHKMEFPILALCSTVQRTCAFYVPMWSKQTPYSRMAPICPKIWSPRCRYTRQPRPSPAAMMLLIGLTDRGMLSSGPSHITSSHIPACGDIWYTGTYRGWFPFQPAMLKWKHPHRCAWNQSQRLPVILFFHIVQL